MEQLDPQIVALAKAIRQHETGNRPIKGQSGEMASRYQFTPGTWKSYAGQTLGDPNAPLTLENENKVVYMKIKGWKEQGYNPAQIASIWNSGKPDWQGKVGTNKYGVAYNVPKYVQSVYKAYQQFKPEGGMQQAGQNVYAQAGQYDVDPGSYQQPQQPEKKSVGGFLKNVVKSGASFVGGVGSAILHPVNTVTNVGKIGLGTVEKLIPGKQGAEKYADAVGQFYKQRYGGLSNIGNTLYNDPVGVGADLATVLTGVGGTASKLGKLGKLEDFAQIPKVAQAAEIARYTQAGGFGKLAKTGQTLSKLGSATDPLTYAGKAISGVTKVGGKIVAGALGTSSGAGTGAVESAYQAGRTGGRTMEDFTNALRGRTNPDQVLEEARTVLGDLKEQRRADYLKQFNSTVKKGTSTASTASYANSAQPSIVKELDTQLLNFKVNTGSGGKLDFSKSSMGDRAGQNVIKQVTADIRGWKDWSPEGLDTLKKRLDDYYTPTSEARAFVQGMKTKVRGTLNDSVPGYEKMTAGYREASDTLKEVEAAIGNPNRVTRESALRKLRSIFRDSQKERLGAIQGAQAKTGKNVTGKMAGIILNPKTPEGLAKYAAEGYGVLNATNPLGLLGLAASSPRLVGEAARILGVSARKAEQILNALELRTGLPRDQIILLLSQAGKNSPILAGL